MIIANVHTSGELLSGAARIELTKMKNEFNEVERRFLINIQVLKIVVRSDITSVNKIIKCFSVKKNEINIESKQCALIPARSKDIYKSQGVANLEKEWNNNLRCIQKADPTYRLVHSRRLYSSEIFKNSNPVKIELDRLSIE